MAWSRVTGDGRSERVRRKDHLAQGTWLEWNGECESEAGLPA